MGDSGYVGVTPRPWKEGTKPSADQLAAWLAICTHAERVAIANAVLRAAPTDDPRVEILENALNGLQQIVAARWPVWQLPNGDIALVQPGTGRQMG